MGDIQLDNLREAIKSGIDRYAEILSRKKADEIETFTAYDEAKDHYFLHELGWDGYKRLWKTPIYVRIRNGKAWIEIDWTEEGIATELLAAGIPKDQIVLAFHHPKVRQHSEFAMA